MIFEAKDGEDTYRVSFCEGKAQFKCDLLDKSYSSYEEIEKAVKAYRLTLRKNFANTSAGYLERWGKGVIKVTVTSLDGDKHAWIKLPNGSRQKAMRESLFMDVQEAQSAMRAEEKLIAEIKDTWAAVERWAPKEASHD